MADRERFAYGQARLLARHGLRPNEAVWRRMEASKGLANYLEVARTTALESWVRPFVADSGSHDIERRLRYDWKAYVRRVAAWQPPAWRPAVLWVSMLVDLPALSHLLRDRPVAEWMQDDHDLAPAAFKSSADRRKAFQLSPLAPIARAFDEGRSPADGWLCRWADLWPDRTPTRRHALDNLAALFTRHLSRLAESEEAGSESARNQLAKDLVYVLRRESQRPPSVFAHLGLVALDLERLRGGLVRRSLFGPSFSEKEK
ncbi:MAG: hypothetical protein A3G18_11100 [Rhodospirillales bacterium RIFCSPLOWO2_12_FULL_58_28]|nr:MAG: hypothetical protein A3H92_10245 [Rhodospirillales bacterium RIFCSPLOWO2_02_FULL_58_16]OHC77746.1 MAG: hypothetical protein A3G18_11100 [Rhodospirillales bacterium RIFCSPLOWO2_12_FULL_58_28]